MLQSKAGYIDARPHIRQLDEILLQRTAGPYIRVRTGLRRCRLKCPVCPNGHWLAIYECTPAHGT
jgi:hypothetical protein